MSTWIKDAILDVLALVLIAVYAVTQNNVLEIVIWVYTSLLLLSKILFFFIGFLKNKATGSKVPDLFYHFIYLVSVGLLIFAPNFYLAGAWAIIWLLSIFASLNRNKSK